MSKPPFLPPLPDPEPAGPVHADIQMAILASWCVGFRMPDGTTLACGYSSMDSH